MTETETNGTTTTAVTIIAPELQIVDGHVTTTSTQVAQHFGKRHKDVARAIRNLFEELPEGYQRNFAPIQIDVDLGMGRTRKDPAYRMTRDGFTLLAMGFTGKEALQWKLAYIDTFNKMEAALTAQLPSNPRQLPSEYISPAQKQHLKELVDIIVASGKQDYPSTWARFQRKFKVNKYEFLSPTQFDDAVAYLQGKMDGQSMAALVQKHFPDATKMVAAPAQAERDFSIVSLKNKRFFHIFDHEGREHIQRVPNDAMMLNFDEMPYSIKNGLPSMAQLVGIVNAGVEAMAKRSGFGKADPMPA